MNRFLHLPVCLACLFMSSLSIAQQAEPREVLVTPIKGALFMLSGRGGNTVASVGDDGVLLIDADYAEYAQTYAEALAGLTILKEPPRFLVNTHWHFDHVGGNAHWGEQGTVILAHENVYQRMTTRQEMKAVNRIVEPSPPAALPVVTYGDSIAIRFNGDTLQAQHFPSGHTDGDTIVFFTEANVVHMGDHYWVGVYPFVDLDSGGNVLGYIANVEKALAMMDEQTIVVAGHNSRSLMSKQDMQRDLIVLKQTTSKIEALLKQGKSVEEITGQGLGPDYAAYGQGFINEGAWISFVANSLQASSL